MYFLASGWLANPAGLNRQTKEKFTSLINLLHWDLLLLRFAMLFQQFSCQYPQITYLGVDQWYKPVISKSEIIFTQN